LLDAGQVPPIARTDCTRRLGELIPLVLPLIDPDAVPVPDAVPLVDPVVPLAAPVPVVSALEPVAEPVVPSDDELLDESSVPVTSTFLPTFFERSVLLLAGTRR
jgi:hypothetical protein